MIQSYEVEKEFKAKLKALFDEYSSSSYRVSIEAIEESCVHSSYADRIEIVIPALYGINGICLRQHATVVLKKYDELA